MDTVPTHLLVRPDKVPNMLSRRPRTVAGDRWPQGRNSTVSLGAESPRRAHGYSDCMVGTAGSEKPESFLSQSPQNSGRT